MQGQGYESLRGRRRAVYVVFGALIVLDVFAVASSGLELNLLDRVEAGEAVTDAELENNDNRQAAVGVLQFALLVVCAIVFIRWLRAAYRNTDVIVPGLRRYGHGWAIGAWFVPFLNLWRPKQIVNDTWRAGGNHDLSPLLTIWWAGWLIDGLLGRIAGRRGLDDETIEDLRTTDALYIVSDALDAVVAVLAIVVVKRISERLDAKAVEPPPAGHPPLPAWSDDPNAATSTPPPDPVAGGWSAAAPEQPPSTG